MVCQKSLKLGRLARQRMKFMCTKYGWNAKRSVHFIDVFMGGIFWGHLVLGIAIVWTKTHLYNPLLLLSWQQGLCLVPFVKVGKLIAPKFGELRPCYNSGV